ncbi:hypothetical protein TSUD_213540 [Trifolium subterraneum]|uniref:Leucine-rich repeat-containing N-terminal plant-type domain-containing protein n=1 Tax=Trifolium subterraneum TaxID=3900 RepID=A0A2Z6P342_TRISU|nr:hypothetical protein TSUD_213540 [Trifolium subterraneum]
MKKNTNIMLINPLAFLLFFSFFTFFTYSQNDDASVMQTLKTNLNPPISLGWSDPDPCKWNHVICSDDKRVTRIQIGRQNLQGTLPQTLQNLTQLEHLELQFNNFSGPIPSLHGLTSLQVFMASGNSFSSIPEDFFANKTQLVAVEIDNNPFEPWEIPMSLKDALLLQNFSANNANVKAFNNLEGVLPKSFSGLNVQSLWLNGQKSDDKLSGSVDVLQNMTSLTEIWLHSNKFTGPLPSFEGLESLKVLSLRDNSFTGVVPSSLGPMPVFGAGVEVDNIKDSNSFCLPSPGDCDPRVQVLLSVVGGMGYPWRFANGWKGNDPCADWIGITCSDGNISIVNFQKMGLSGIISPEFAKLKSLQRLLLSDNNLTGSIPNELTTLPKLTYLNVANNHLFGKVPSFRSNVIVSTSGNIDIGKDKSSSPPQGSVSSNGTDASGGNGGSNVNDGKKSSHVALIVMKQKKLSRVQSPNALVIHPRHSGSDNESVKITVAGSSVSVGGVSEAHAVPNITGRVTTKVDVFSFGVILMELITGRKALDDSQPEDSMHLVAWFRRMYIDKDSFRKAIDPTIDINEETLANIHTVAELASHCSAREPYQRPDMGHAVNVLSSLVEQWKPSDTNSEDIYGIDLDLSLPQALKKWQAYEGASQLESSSSSLLPSLDNTQTSIPNRPYGFADSFTSADGR